MPATKSQINAVLKTKGYGFVKVTKGDGSTPVYKDIDGTKYKGIKAGSIGPMTVSSAHLDHNREVMESLRDTLQDEINAWVYSDTQEEMCLSYQRTPNKTGTITLKAVRFPAYAPCMRLDPSYKNFWVTVSID